MSEPIAEKLSRFTPDTAGLDRDALLFAAGRASARPNRSWMALAGVLAATQLLTLVLLWPRPAALPGIPDMAETPPPAATVPAPVDVPAPPTPGPSSLWVLQQEFLDDGREPAPTSTLDDMVPPAPPLRAFLISADVFSN